MILENVCGTLTSREGADFAAISKALVGAGYHFGALVVDAVHFLPQSRPRLFVIAVRAGRSTPPDLKLSEPGEAWHTPAETARLLSMMSRVNLEKVTRARKAKRLMIGTIYKRTRTNEEGVRTQRAEVRFDGVAGCLHTPMGGSSRQTILLVEGNKIRSRLLSPREAARLMGIPDDYKLPDKYNAAYHLAGDGVVVPVVRHIAKYILEPLLEAPLEVAAA